MFKAPYLKLKERQPEFDFITTAIVSDGLEAYLEKKWFEEEKKKKQFLRQLTAGVLLLSFVFSSILRLF